MLAVKKDWIWVTNSGLLGSVNCDPASVVLGMSLCFGQLRGSLLQVFGMFSLIILALVI